MGEKKNRLAKLKQEHPKCCFCGGSKDTQTIEHTPPKVLFLKKSRPDALFFPACKRCNNGSSSQDSFVSLISLSQAQEMLNEGAKFNEYDDYFKKVMRSVQNKNFQANKLFVDAGKTERRLKGLIREFNVIKLKPEAYTDYLEPWFAKQTIALWYKHTGRIFTENGAIRINHYMTHEKQIYANLISNLPIDFSSPAQNLSQGSWRTPDQFQYQYNFSSSQGIGLCAVELHKGLAYVALVSDRANYKFTDNASLISNDRIWRTSAEKGIHHTKAII
ncbi:hypothetical protein [Candidatus Puniceispirillum marinum]|uniref:HNH endonuclease n=1 Tax=Puniceispirillum marinum (strain IMCC1322) TaxID=488538 RepID=D5BQF0_PUNMI|nr:hypothetical protein [Candidatus Puniceispirillum marinum]ADE40668.1 hypothetical protein SAR116_2425 [Candidatus Puniceispirillum marinum IMCC1322]